MSRAEIIRRLNEMFDAGDRYAAIILRLVLNGGAICEQRATAYIRENT